MCATFPQKNRPPRMRGALCRHHSDGGVVGIIPAYARSTSPASGCRASCRDHPRVCGEHPNVSAFPPATAGSSPRMRGALGLHKLVVLLRGIIPAYAGSTSFRHRANVAGRDHPRVCGEHIGGKPRALRISGSSPRMRGARKECMHSRVNPGIIPAYAGSTARSHRL